MILTWNSGLARPGTAPWVGLGYLDNWVAVLAGPAPPSFHVLPEHAFTIRRHTRDFSAGHESDFTKARTRRDFKVN